METILSFSSLSDDLFSVSEKILSGNRITSKECLALYNCNDLFLLSALSSHVKNKINRDIVYFNRNFHIEPTNICVYNCRFCSYSRKSGDPGAWELSVEEVLEKVATIKDKKVTELHIVGGAHPDRDLYYYADMLKKIKNIRPQLHIKAFTAVELEHMVNLAGVSLREGLAVLKVAGLDSIPGGGAEIFNETIRKNICGSKTKSKAWLAIHETAHKLGIPSNATILYGHIETYEHRVDHMERLRNLQDKTGKFNAFIPLKYRNKNNELSQYKETTIIEDLKNYAVARIYLDNIPHLKAYWPMIGKETTQLALNFGVDDIDGTIEDSTKIYIMAGEKSRPSLSVKELCDLVRKTGRKPVERDSVYNVIKEY